MSYSDVLSEFKQLLDQYASPSPAVSAFGLSEDQKAKLVAFYEIVLEENEKQNLTRLISPEDFFFGHVQDVLELLQWNQIDYPALDLGSGAGVPGLLAALLTGQSWILSDSESHKADYLVRTAERLGLTSHVRVTHGRAEDFLKTGEVKSIVARAVGPVDRIYAWIQNCSTWNNLVLLKGPGWNEEWEKFQKTKWRNRLRVSLSHAYSTGPEKKQRVFIKLTRT